MVGRYYDPSTAQFLSVDPDVMTTGQPYAFTGDDPLNATDPLGLTARGNYKITGNTKGLNKAELKAVENRAKGLDYDKADWNSAKLKGIKIQKVTRARPSRASKEDRTKPADPNKGDDESSGGGEGSSGSSGGDGGGGDGGGDGAGGDIAGIFPSCGPAGLLNVLGTPDDNPCNNWGGTGHPGPRSA